MMINGLTSMKLVAYEPSPSPTLACTTLVRPPDVAQLTTTSLPDVVVTDVMCKYDALLVGSLPDRNSHRLLHPSPSGSAVATAAGLVVLPKYRICQLWKA